jgi:predicted transcriptional regulator
MANNVIGQVIKEEREQAGIKLVQLATLMPADIRTIYRYQAGQVNPDIVARLAQVIKSKRIAEIFCTECPVRNVRFKKKRPPFWKRSLKNA